MRLFYEEGKTRSKVMQLLGVQDPYSIKASLKL
jgi:hypothetical protein